MPVCKKYEIFSGTTIYNYTDCLEIVQSNGGRRALQTTCAEHFQGEDLSTMKIWSAAKVIFLKKCPYFPQSFVKESNSRPAIGRAFEITMRYSLLSI